LSGSVQTDIPCLNACCWLPGAACADSDCEQLSSTHVFNPLGMNSLQSSSTKRPPSALIKPPLACWANVEPKHKDKTNNKPKCRPPPRILPRAVSGSQAGFDATRRLKLMRVFLALHSSKLPPQRLHKMHCDFPQFTHRPCFLGTVEWAMTYPRSVRTLDTLTACAHFHNRHLQSYGVSSIVSIGSNGTDHTAKLGDRCRSTFCT